MPNLVPFLIFFLLPFFALHCSARDTVTLGSPISDKRGDTLISSGGVFELGFFSPNGSAGKRRYVGIWYYSSTPRTVVWVANRDDPVLDSNGVFSITEDGNLGVLDGSGRSHWSTNLGTSSLSSSPTLKLMDSGNLVLRRQENRSAKEMILWQSFENPTDTFLPGMRMNENITLTSWGSYDDPAPGNFTFELDEEEENQYIVWRRSIRYWKSGVSGKFITSDDMPYAISYVLSNFTSSVGQNNSVPYITSSLFDNTRLIMSVSGQVQYVKWDSQKIWSLIWAEPRDRCSVYNMCGNFGSCNSNGDVVCKCLPGFGPASLEFWSSGDFSGGCIRKSTLCGKSATGDTFLSLKGMKVGKPDSQFVAKDGMECRRECLNNCQCQAYSYNGDEDSRVCWIWTEDLNNLQDEYEDGRDLYIRMAVSDLESTDRDCLICGANLIPYPLSTGAQCGDPAYLSFHCNISSGQLSFEALSGTYQITRINPESRKFFIKLEADSCNNEDDSKVLQLNESSPFHLTRWCNADKNSAGSGNLIGRGDEVEITWDPPQEPTCSSSLDCKDWPDSTCHETLDGKRRCICNSKFRWDPLLINCTQDKKLGGPSSEKLPSTLIVIVIFISSVFLIVLLAMIVYLYIQRRNPSKRPENWASIWRHSAPNLYNNERHVKSFIDSGRFNEDETNGIDVPFFDLESILAATGNFANANKLGQGGFGPVYKGKFPGGQAIAVKRLSSFSGQGFEEFKNEVVLIAKLQHRNLVRLLGYCVEGDEKMLLYEYMPNKSLDSFIFDRTLCMSLDWVMRYKIIAGIARGLLYLHQDSRLRIIHRDLKTANILLDEEMNPRISDFGLARIIGGKETAESTNSIVGTYGYMSPEYALDGFFSVKSDVFSFGVVVLEIITGKRNTGFYHSEQEMSLLGYAWLLWKEEKALDLMDTALCKSCNVNEFLKCVNIGLLCVQEDPNDRPKMSNVLFMLGSEIATLPSPKKPAFVVRRCPSSRASLSSKLETCSHNDLTVTLKNGR
ncbi:hypothetical protein CDL15_Pgr002766 [Punica granatum]|nr:hypothetical protein CDL15_Pgr002766 [Punica granatum]